MRSWNMNDTWRRPTPIPILTQKSSIPPRSKPRRTTSTPVFYVCSSGGCGSTMLARYLSQFGTVHHIHDRHPPSHLCHVVNEWFDTRRPVQHTENHHVLFLYRNPVEVVWSRCANNVQHLRNIQCDNPTVSFADMLTSGHDAYGLQSFYNAYTSTSCPKAYGVHLLQYEYMWTPAVCELGLPVPTVIPETREHQFRNRQLVQRLLPPSWTVANAEARLQAIYRPWTTQVATLPPYQYLPPSGTFFLSG